MGQWLFYVDEWEQEVRERQAAFGVKGTRPLPFISSSLFFPMRPRNLNFHQSKAFTPHWATGPSLSTYIFIRPAHNIVTSGQPLPAGCAAPQIPSSLLTGQVGCLVLSLSSSLSRVGHDCIAAVSSSICAINDP